MSVFAVALHPEGVDRNTGNWKQAWQGVIALHPEGVDRNPGLYRKSTPRLAVALHPEGVDRNWRASAWEARIIGSPSTRRAWIEIPLASLKLRVTATSPSTRRAWIEIPEYEDLALLEKCVALHPEGVDRN